MTDLPPSDKVIELSRPLGARPVTDADYRTMIDSVTDYAIFLLDVNGAIRTWNAGARLLKQYEEHEVIGRHFSMFYPQELKDRDWPAHQISEAKRLGRFEDEGWRVRKDGTRFWASIVITRLAFPNGDLRGFTKITRDVSDRRKHEEQLRLSEERFRLLVESVKDYAIYMLDPSGHVLSWNSGAEKNKGYKAAEIIGRHFSVFYPADVAASGAPQRELDHALEHDTYEEEGWRVRKDGSRFWAGIVLTSVRDERGHHRGFAKVTRDLTESRKVSVLEDEGRKITEFLAMLGHELRNPLAPITTAVALIRKLDIESLPLKRAHEMIDRQVKHLTHLVDDLLDVSRITSGKIRLDAKPVRMQDVMGQAAEAIAALVMTKRHRLVQSLETEDVWVSGDRTRLVQIVTNLLHNAAKFTQDGGRIDIELKVIGHTVEVRVRDNGPGIPTQRQSDVFNLFVQGVTDSARSTGGLGLGLSLTRQLVAMHGAEIDLYSKGIEGAGCEFVVRLPTIKTPARGRLPQTPGARRKVWVIDDNRDAADSLQLLLEAMGYDSGVSYDGISGLACVIEQAPDAVLLDIALPGLTGLEVAVQVAAQIQDPPRLIAVSGYNQDIDRESTFKAGFAAHLSKPVDVERLAALLKQMVD